MFDIFTVSIDNHVTPTSLVLQTGIAPKFLLLVAIIFSRVTSLDDTIYIGFRPLNIFLLYSI